MGDEWWKKVNGIQQGRAKETMANVYNQAKDVTQSEDHLKHQTNNHHAVLITNSTLSISKNNLSPISPQ